MVVRPASPSPILSLISRHTFTDMFPLARANNSLRLRRRSALRISSWYQAVNRTNVNTHSTHLPPRPSYYYIRRMYIG
ncbi:hypothetical protein HCEG_01960 [Histoplasma capsulatum var. duboisii H88]|uniref:Uncharacterized protein n=1 Tax=Ajellomyces capsulatus (strain H88) TaxID=544711 RepID=F0U9S3_AJEC8|nr:hypothetical protein HCEG_01960 [Histoplasma capsulatum var. duboisii H88]